jgi:amino-acid N-acetyltransferase
MTNQNSPDVLLGAAETGELPKILALLKKCDLPTEGLADHLPTVLVARNDKQIVGTLGLELYQECALLRSVAVDPSFRER